LPNSTPKCLSTSASIRYGPTIRRTDSSSKPEELPSCRERAP
jgi:hypothetical protein